MARKPKVSIIILTWNQKKLTHEQMKGVAKLETKGLDTECILCDNGSTDGTEESFKDYKLPNMGFHFLQNGKNLGFAAGNNPGIKYSMENGADYIILMNNDLILVKDLLIKLVKVAQKGKKIGLVSPKMYFAKGYEFHKNRYKKSELGKVIWYAGGIIDRDNVYSSHKGVDEVDVGQYDKQEETDLANGAVVLITKEVVEKIGLMDESFFLYWEDADYSEKARRAGFKVVYTPETHVWHMVSSGTGGSGSPSNDYFLVRNRLIFGLRYSPLRTKIALLRDSLRMLFIGRQWQKRGVIDFFFGRWGKGRWGKK